MESRFSQDRFLIARSSRNAIRRLIAFVADRVARLSGVPYSA
jgi:hypothetical protein